MKAANAIRITRRYLLVKMRLSDFKVSGRTIVVSAQILHLVDAPPAEWDASGSPLEEGKTADAMT